MKLKDDDDDIYNGYYFLTGKDSYEPVTICRVFWDDQKEEKRVSYIGRAGSESLEFARKKFEFSEACIKEPRP